MYGKTGRFMEETFISGYKCKDISADLGNLADSTKIFMDMNSLTLADVDCY